MSLKERILKEMVDTEEERLAREIFRELPSELQTNENMIVIRQKISESKGVNKT